RTGSTRDQDNNLVPSFTDVPYSRASITWLESESETDSRDTTVYVLKIVLRPGIEVTSSDEVTARGLRWTITGEPVQERNPFTGATITRITAQRAKGELMVPFEAFGVEPDESEVAAWADEVA